MINIVSRTCVFSNCKILPCYNDQKTGIYCNLHKLEGMIDVKLKIVIKDQFIILLMRLMDFIVVNIKRMI